jgi:16S rRNA (uracil1498-N3)-methyltransferase
VVFDGSGREWTAVLDTFSPGPVSGILGKERRPDVELPVSISVCQALVRPERFELVLQKAAELGAARIVPLVTARVQGADSALPSGSRLERWRRVVQEAAEQSGRVLLPEVAQTLPLEAAVKEEAGHGPVVLLWEGGPENGLRTVLRAIAAHGLPRRLALVTGPVGGFEETEVAGAVRAGAAVAGMGPRVLRSETAAIAALTAAVYELGFLGG